MCFKIIDLFCGAGGMTKGFHDAGFRTLYAVEYDKIYAKSYKLNFPEVDIDVSDIRNITNEYIENKFKNVHIDVIVGGPPCQGFSIAGNIGRKILDDDRNILFKDYLRFVKIIQPRVFVIENVAALEKHNYGKTITNICQDIEKLGYNITYKVLNSAYYDVPQERRRIFIIGYKKSITFNFPVQKNKTITIKEAIDDLPVLQSGESSNIYLHNAMNHTKQMLEKMKFVQDGGNRYDIPIELRPKTGDNRKYIRYNSKRPSICITGDMRKVFHYSQNRALTCRELARIQSFPDTYKFYGSTIKIQQQIGNAVPPKLAYYIANQIKEALKNE